MAHVVDPRLEYTDVEHSIIAQSIFCTKNNLPRFAPDNGICPSCSNQIYEEITVAEAAASIVSGCPHCNTSYVE